MFKKKLSVVMLASLGLFGCDWNDDDKKAVEEAVKDNVTEEVVKPEGLNVQVEFYNEVPELLNDQQVLLVEVAFEIDNPVRLTQTDDFIVSAVFTNGEANVNYDAYKSAIKERSSKSPYIYVVEKLGVAKLESINGKTVVNLNILPKPILANHSDKETDILLGPNKDDPILIEYLTKMAKAKTASTFDIRSVYTEKYGRSEDYLSDDGNVLVQLSSDTFSDSKDDYSFDINYADIERVTISFD